MSKRIYTRKGDKGKTSLLTGERISKDSKRTEAYGTIDELNTVVGIARIHCKSRVKGMLHRIQERLFYVAAELATPDIDSITDNDTIQALERISQSDVEDLESWADALSEELPLLKNFVVPGGTKGSVFLHQARTVCRRAERRIVSFSIKNKVSESLMKYINRFSDLLFVMARYENLMVGCGDELISREGVETQTVDD